MKQHMQKFGFFYILIVLFLLSLILQFWTQTIVITHEAITHGEMFMWTDFWPHFLQSVFENWQSEFLQLAVQALGMVMFAKYVFKKAKEDSERMERKIDELLDRKE